MVFIVSDKDRLGCLFYFLSEEFNYMWKSDDQKEVISGDRLRIFRWLFFINVLAFSSLAAAGDAPPDIKKLITPAPVADVVLIQPFTLKESYRHDWRAERPLVSSGTLVVFKVNPDYVFPRNAAEFVLYAGYQTAQRLNYGNESGYVIAIIPGDIDLAREPVWFGDRQLPEWVDAKTIEAQRAKADRAGIKPFDAEKVRSVTRERVGSSDLASLLREQVAELVLKYSPQEKALAEAWLLPVAQR
jgi:hypothetical protein